MALRGDCIEVISNFRLQAYERGKKVPGTLREGHNVFTDVGSDWLASLVAWFSLGGAGDVAYTNRRVRWMALGTGAQAETPGVTSLAAPTLVTTGRYLGAIQTTLKPTSTSMQWIKEFGQGEVSLPPTLPIVGVTEAGLFVDVFPVSTGGGHDDGAVGAGDTTLDPTASNNPLVAYHTFEVVNKIVDFAFRVEWTFTFR